MNVHLGTPLGIIREVLPLGISRGVAEDPFSFGLKKEGRGTTPGPPPSHPSMLALYLSFGSFGFVGSESITVLQSTTLSPSLGV